MQSRERRADLLRALEQQLRHASLADVSISGVARAAGVGRSAFYFYFPNKYEAVAALLVDIHDDLVRRTDHLLHGVGDPTDNLAEALRHTAVVWRQHATLFRAMLTAGRADDHVRTILTDWVRLFEDTIVEIARDQFWPLARTSDVALRDVVAALLAMNVQLLGDLVETAAHTDPADSDHEVERIAALMAHIWTRTLFERTDP